MEKLLQMVTDLNESQKFKGYINLKS